MQVLVVDDARDTRALLRVMLEQLGHTVIEACDGKEAVQTALGCRPDFILMDVSMPAVSGLVATAALRTILPLRHVPIVAVTGYPDQVSRTDALTAGCNAYLEKPLAFETLADLLNRFGKPRSDV